MFELKVINLFVLNSSTGAAKIIAMGLVAAAITTFSLVYRQLKGSGILTKQGRELRNLSKTIKKLDLKINNLKSLSRDDIISEKELKEKTENILTEKERLLNQLSLRSNAKYVKLIEAEKDGLITKDELKTKIEQLQQNLTSESNKRKNIRDNIKNSYNNTKKSNKLEFKLGINKLDEHYYQKCYKIDQGQLEIYGILENRNYLGDKVFLNGEVANNGIYNIDWYTQIKVKNGVIAE